MKKEHQYNLKIDWTGNTGTGTQDYKTYGRSHEVKIDGKPDISLSSDPAFRGDKTKHNPEELLLASVSSCHMLWYLHLCAVAGVDVLAYEDSPTGIMIENEDGSGQFTEITLQPSIVLSDENMRLKADELHEKANKNCFIANSCNFPIHHKAIYHVRD
jgi:organic hydroperoxide reductase OsmC/OhrA